MIGKQLYAMFSSKEENQKVLESKRWIELLDPTPQPYSDKFLRLSYKIIYQETCKKVKDFEPIII